MALEMACDRSGLDLDELVDAAIDQKEALIARMQELQEEASQDAAKVTGLSVESQTRLNRWDLA